MNEADSETKKWKNNNDELKIQKENLSKQMKALKEGLEDEIARAETEKVHLEEERLELQESMDKAIQKLKTELLEAETRAIQEKEELKSYLETDHKQKFSKLNKDKDEQIHFIKKELDDTINTLTQLKQSHTEEILSLEQSKQKSIIIAQQEQKSLNERLEETMQNLEVSRDEIEKIRREGGSKLEKDRASIAELQLEISKLQSLLQDKSDVYEDEKSILTVNLNKEKQEKINAENEVVMLKSTLKVTNDKIAQLNIEVQDTKLQLDEINDSKKNALLNLNDTEKRLEESKLQNERLDQIKTNLNETIKDLDDEKASLETDLKNSKSRSRQIEDNLHNANQDIETLRNKCHLIETDNQELEDQVNYWQSQHQDLLNDHRELEVHYDNLKTQLINEDEQKQAGSKETQNLRLKISELESSKSILERELTSLKTSSEQDQDTLRQRIATLNQTIGIVISRALRTLDFLDKKNNKFGPF